MRKRPSSPSRGEVDRPKAETEWVDREHRRMITRGDIFFVILPKGRTQFIKRRRFSIWVPAFAGMTGCWGMLGNVRR